MTQVRYSESVVTSSASSGSSAASTDPRALRSREAVIDAAIELLSRPGAPSTELTITQLAERAGVSRRAIYLNFETLENVFLHAVVALLGRAFPERPFSLTSTTDTSTPPELLSRLARHLAENADFYTGVLTGPSSYLAVTYIRDTFHADTLTLLRTAAPDADDQFVDFVLFGVVGMCTTTLAAGPADADALAHRLWETLRRCLPSFGPTASHQ